MTQATTYQHHLLPVGTNYMVSTYRLGNILGELQKFTHASSM